MTYGPIGDHVDVPGLEHIGYALVYPIVVPAVMFLIAVFLMPETRKHSIWEEGAIEAARGRA
jgi:cytochrome c oxidase subunit IV